MKVVVIPCTSEHRTKIIVKDVPHYRVSRWNGHGCCFLFRICISTV